MGILLYTVGPKTVRGIILLAVYFTGLLLSLGYTPIFKRYGLGELGGFLAVGFLNQLFCYTANTMPNLNVLVAFVPLSIYAAAFFTVDQWVDAEHDYEKGRVSLAVLLWLGKTPIQAYIYSGVTLAYIVCVIAWILKLIPPLTVLVNFLSYPIVVYLVSLLTVNVEKAIKIGLITLVYILPLLNCLSLIPYI